MPTKRREALAKYFLDLSKIALAIGVLTPLLAPAVVNLPKLLSALIVAMTFGIMGYNLQPKE